MLRILVVGLVLLVAVLLVIPRPIPAPENATFYDEPLPLPEVALTDSGRGPFTTGDLEGRFHLLFFGFTHCPDVCPLTLQRLAMAMELLRERDARTPRVLLVSVDPARDTPERLDAYVTAFDPEFLGVTGPEGALEPWLTTLGVTVMRQTLDDGQYNMVHNPQVFVVSPEAELVAIMSNADDPETVAADYRRIQRLHSARSAAR